MCRCAIKKQAHMCLLNPRSSALALVRGGGDEIHTVFISYCNFKYSWLCSKIVSSAKTLVHPQKKQARMCLLNPWSSARALVGMKASLGADSPTVFIL